VYDLTRFSRKVIEGERLVELAAMAPLLARIESLQTKLAGLATPAQAELAAADAVAAWDDAAERGDFPGMRAMIRRVFPNLTITAQTYYNDHGPHRILWNPPTTKAA
jgi:hypothetical protein